MLRRTNFLSKIVEFTDGMITYDADSLEGFASWINDAEYGKDGIYVFMDMTFGIDKLPVYSFEGPEDQIDDYEDMAKADLRKLYLRNFKKEKRDLEMEILQQGDNESLLGNKRLLLSRHIFSIFPFKVESYRMKSDLVMIRPENDSLVYNGKGKLCHMSGLDEIKLIDFKVIGGYY